ncbi:MAG: hypothetical protein H6607_00310 [Flavobacteriales bacterium]|nr:hypothetical protein [Flavobacteriales bacterium]
MIHASEAIKAKDRMTRKPAWFLLMILPLIILKEALELKPWFFAVVFLLPLTITFIAYNHSILKWRIWALTNVDNPALFKKWAQQRWIIPIEGNLDTFEYQTKKYKQKWAALQHRFDEEVKVQPVEIPANGMLLERSILVKNRFGTHLLGVYDRKNLFMDNDKMVVEQIGEFYWAKMQHISIDVDWTIFVRHHKYERTLGRVFTLSFRYLGNKISLPIHPKSDLALIERVVTAKTTFF